MIFAAGARGGCALVLASGAAASPDPGVYQAKITGASPAVLNGT